MFARDLIIRFIEAEKRRVEDGLTTANTLHNNLKPIKLALELNELAFG